MEVEIRPGDEYYTKLQIEVALGTAPDTSVNDVEQVIPFAARGVLVGLQPFFDRDAIDESIFWCDHATEWGWKGELYLATL